MQIKLVNKEWDFYPKEEIVVSWQGLLDYMEKFFGRRFENLSVEECDRELWKIWNGPMDEGEFLGYSTDNIFKLEGAPEEFPKVICTREPSTEEILEKLDRIEKMVTELYERSKQ